MADRGPNGGFYGVISFNKEDLPGLDANIAFNINVASGGANLTARPIVRTGPMTAAGQPSYRLGDIRGGFPFTGEFVPSGFPVPTDLRYATGTLTQQLDAGMTVASLITVSALSWNHVETGEGASETWEVSGNAVLAGSQTWSWKGHQLKTVAPAANDSETFEGRSKTYDSNGLTTSAIRRVDCQGIGILDTAETAKLVALVAASTTPPEPNLKVVNATLTRAEDDSTGCQIVVTFGLQDSKDDIETPRKTVLTDPWDLESTAALAMVYAIGSPPSTPTAPTGLKLRHYTDQKLNDQKAFRFYEWAKRDSKDDQVLPRTGLSTDPDGVTDSGSVADLDNSPSVPDGYELVGTKIEYATSDHTVITKTYGLKTPKQAIEYENSSYTIDPNDLTTIILDCYVYNNIDGAPSASAPSGLKLVSSDIQEVNINVSRIVFRYAKRDSKDDEELPRTKLELDATSLGSEGTIAELDGTPSTPTGYVLVSTTTEHPTTDHSVTTIKYALRNTQQGIEQDESPTEIDPKDIETVVLDTHVYSTGGTVPAASIPTGLQLTDTKTIILNNIKSKVTYRYEKNTSRDKAVLPHIWESVDPTGITSNGEIADMDATPSVPSGYETVSTRTDYLTPDHTRVVLTYGLKTAQQDIEYGASESATDPNDLITYVLDAHVYALSGSPPAASIPTGLLLDSTTLKKVNVNKGLVIYRYAKNDSKTTRQQAETYTLNDPSGLASEARAALIDSAPSLPTGFVSRGNKTQQVTPDHAINVVEGGLRSTIEDVTMPGTFAAIDVSGLENQGKETLIFDNTGNVPTATAPTGLLVRESAITKETGDTTTHLSRVVYTLGVRTSAEDVTMPGTVVQTDLGGLTSEGRQTLIYDNTGNIPVGSAPGGQVIRNNAINKETSDGTTHLSKIVYSTGVRTSVEDITLPGTMVETDPHGLTSVGKQTLIYDNTGNIPVATAPSGLVERTLATNKETSDSTTHLSKAVYEYGVRSTVEDMTLPNTVTSFDVSGLTSEGRQTLVFDNTGNTPSPTVPSGLILRDTAINKETSDATSHLSKVVFTTGTRTPAQDITFPGTFEQSDVSDLRTTGRQTIIFDSAGNVPAATVPSGLVLRNTTITQETDANATHLSRVVYEMGKLTTQQDEEFQQERTIADPNAISSITIDASVFTNGSPPSTPSTPTGLKIVDSTDVPLTPTKSIRVWQFGTNDSIDKLVNPKTTLDADPTILTSRQMTAAMFATGSPPTTPTTPTAGLKLVNQADAKITDALTLRVYEWGRKTSADEVVNPRTTDRADISGVESQHMQAAIYTGAAPSDPSAPSGLKLRTREDLKLDDDYLVRVWTFATKTVQDDLELAQTNTHIDPNAIKSESSLASLWATGGSVPSAPSAPSGLKLVDYVDHSITPAYSLRVWSFGTNDSKDELERSVRHGSMVTTDSNGIDSSGRVSILGTTATPPSAPGAPTSNVTLARTSVRPITDTQSLFIYEFETLDSVGKLQLTQSYTDPDGLDSTARIPVVNGMPSTPSTPANLTLVGSEDHQINASNTVTIGMFGTRTRKQAMQYDGSIVSTGIATTDNVERVTTIETIAANVTIEAATNTKYLAVFATTSPTFLLPYKRVTGQRYNATSAIFVVTYQAPTLSRVNPGTREIVKANVFIIRGESWIGFDPDGTPFITVIECLTRGSGKYLVRLGKNQVNTVGGAMTDSYQITLPATDRSSDIGNTNNAPYQGRPAGTVQYNGSSYDELGNNLAYQTDYYTYSKTPFGDVQGASSSGKYHTTSGAYTSPGKFTGSLSGSKYTWDGLPIALVVPSQATYPS
jgi:hypothetical protein